LQQQLTPDGVRYFAAAEQRVARPFHLRWLLPRLLGDNFKRWQYVTHGALFALLPLMYVYAGGGWRGLAAALMVLGLSGVWKFNRKYPVLVDATGVCLALSSAVAFQHGLWPLGLALALVGGCVRETSPIFAALYCWNPLALLGMVAPAVRSLQREGPDVLDGENEWILRHPFRAGWIFHRHKLFMNYVLPWGAAVVAFANGSPQLALTCAVAYAQCLVATDTIRLYQWAFPVVLVAAVGAVPLAWLPVIVAITLANPFAGEGG
jgi:hypothetical protein